MLARLGYRFTAEAAEIDETVRRDAAPERAVTEIALRKAEKVQKNHPGNLVVGADTLVFLNGKALGKPEGEEDAARMLKSLSGRAHEVYTGVAVLSPRSRETFFSRTLVRFYELSDEYIARYIATGEPTDKAGAYGIQGFGALLVEGIEGDWSNVVGLPVAALARRLDALGIRPDGF